MRPEDQPVDQPLPNRSPSPMSRSKCLLEPLFSHVHELRSARSIIDQQVYFAVIPSLAHRPAPSINQPSVNYTFLCIEQTLTYSPFFQDYGPFNMSQVTRFTHLMRYYLEPSNNVKSKQVVILYCLDAGRALSNAAALIGSWLVIDRQHSLQQSYSHFKCYEPFQYFIDASDNQGANRAMNATLNLQPYDVIDAVVQALKHGFYSCDSFDCPAYEHYECVENGDLNIIIPRKFLAFAGPEQCTSQHQSNAYTPERLLPILQTFNVKAIVRLNHAMYDAQYYVSNEIAHHDLCFPDGSSPDQQVINTFFHIVDQYQTPACQQSPSQSPSNKQSHKGTMIGIHCKAGLGRTGTLIALWLMRQHRYTVKQAICWLRLMRPGSVIGEQMLCLVQQQSAMHSWYDKHVANQHIQECKTVKSPLVKPATKPAIKSSSRRTTASSLPLTALPMSVQPINLTTTQTKHSSSSRTSVKQTTHPTINCEQLIDTTRRSTRSQVSKSTMLNSLMESKTRSPKGSVTSASTAKPR